MLANLNERCPLTTAPHHQVLTIGPDEVTGDEVIVEIVGRGAWILRRGSRRSRILGARSSGAQKD